MLKLGFGQGWEAPLLDHTALFHQRRVNGHGQAGDLLLGFGRHFAKGLGLHRLLALGGFRQG